MTACNSDRGTRAELRILVVLVALLAVPAARADAPPYPAAPAAVGALAASIAGRPVTVLCADDAGWASDPHPEDLGYVRAAWNGQSFTPLYAVLSPGVCPAITLAMRDPRGRLPAWSDVGGPFGESAAPAEAWGLYVLAHESEHLAYVWSEGWADCFALQVLPELMRRIGIPPWRRRVLLALAWDYHRGSPPEYRTVC